MTKPSAIPIPTDYKRVVLLNPTRYLGNLLIAGGIIQQYLKYCQSKNIDFLLVVDSAYKELLLDSFPAECLLFYPRSQIKNSTLIKKISAYLDCLLAVRRFNADIAFNIEEDSVSHRLTQLSGAKFKLGSNLKRNRHGYDYVMDINYLKREQAHKHRWYGFAEIFNALGLSVTQPSYLKLAKKEFPPALKQKISNLGVDINKPFIVIHASAAKDYKKWPAVYFTELISLLNEQGYCVVLIGAGMSDQLANGEIMEMLKANSSDYSCIDLCNQLTLFELSLLFTLAKAMIGNDSGPFHLAAAMGLKGCVIFGPTDVALWRPLSENTIVLKSEEVCDPTCTKTGCIYENRCLVSIKPYQALESLQSLF